MLLRKILKLLCVLRVYWVLLENCYKANNQVIGDKRNKNAHSQIFLKKRIFTNMSQFDDLFYDENDKNAPAIPNVIAREILINGIIEKDDGRWDWF